MSVSTAWTDALLAIRNGNSTARWNYPQMVGASAFGETGLGQAVTLSYGFPTSVPGDYNGKAESAGFRALTSAEQTAVQWALSQISAVCNVSFVQAQDSTAQMRLAATTFTDPTTAAYTNYPQFNVSYDSAWKVLSATATGIAGDVWLARGSYDRLATSALTPGSTFAMVMLHELGHALGLKHPDEGFAQLPSSMNSQFYTVMTNNRVATSQLPDPSSLMPLDIAALQVLYGANTQTGAGDDVYSFSPSAKVLKTIWDAGGVNSMDFSGFTSATTLNVYEGGLSKASGSGGDTAVAVAYGVKIHKVVAGSGDDTITAGAALRDIDGGAGSDTVLMPYGAYRFDQQSAATTMQLQNVERVKSGKSYVTEMAAQDINSGLVRAEAKAISELYLGSFGRAPDADGLDYWLQQNYSGNASLQQMAAGFVSSAEYQVRFPSGTSPSALVTAVYNNVLSRAPDSAGLNYWVDALAKGSATAQSLLLSMLGGAQGSDRTLLNNRDDVALYYTAKMAETGGAYDQAGITSLLQQISADTHTVAAAHTQIDLAAQDGVSLAGQLPAQAFSLV